MNTEDPDGLLPEVLNKQEQSALLDEPDPLYPIELRNLGFLRIELNYGLRLSEARFLRWNQIDLNNGKLHVISTGLKDRLFCLSKPDLTLVRNWKRQQEYEQKKRMLQEEKTSRRSGFTFTNLNGTRITKQYLKNMVSMNADEAGISKEVSPKTLRHTFATDLYLETGNLRVVQRALGHRSLSGTLLYKRLAERKVKRSLKNIGNALVISRRRDLLNPEEVIPNIRQSGQHDELVCSGDVPVHGCNVRGTP